MNVNKEKLSESVRAFRDKKVLVLGDVMLDRYILGDAVRISPEAPVPVVNVTHETAALGGSANVVANIRALGGSAHIVGVVGADAPRDSIERLLAELDVDTTDLLVDNERMTTQKVRVVARTQQMLRYDYEMTTSLTRATEDTVSDAVERAIADVDVVVVSDYAKGVIGETLMRNVTAWCKTQKKILVVDPKPVHTLWYDGATVITPNYIEACAMAEVIGESYDAPDFNRIGVRLAEVLQSTLLMTRGEHGMSLFQEGRETQHIPTFAREVFDVVGAGDTSIAALALALGAGSSFEEAAVIANHAAGVTVGKRGTSTVSPEELLASITGKGYN